MTGLVNKRGKKGLERRKETPSLFLAERKLLLQFYFPFSRTISKWEEKEFFFFEMRKWQKRVFYGRVSQLNENSQDVIDKLLSMYCVKSLQLQNCYVVNYYLHMSSSVIYTGIRTCDLQNLSRALYHYTGDAIIFESFPLKFFCISLSRKPQDFPPKRKREKPWKMVFGLFLILSPSFCVRKKSSSILTLIFQPIEQREKENTQPDKIDFILQGLWTPPNINPVAIFWHIYPLKLV